MGRRIAARFVIVGAVGCFGGLTVVTDASARTRDGRLQIKVSGLPAGQHADVRLTGPGGFRRGLARSQVIVAAPGRYKATVIKVRISHATRRVPRGSIASPESASPRSVRVRPGRTTTLRLSYGTIRSARLRTLGAPVLSFTGSSRSPSTITLARRAGLSVGSILTRPPSAQFPAGLFASVTAIARAGRGVRLSLRPAPLSTAFPALDLSGPVSLSAGASDLRQAHSPLDPIDFGFPAGAVDCGVPLTSGYAFSAHTHLGASANVDLHFPFLGEPHGTVSITLNGGANLAYTLPAGVHCDKTIADLPPLEGDIGGVPVYAQVSAVVSASIAKDWHVTASGQLSLTAGVTFKGTHVKPILDLSPRGSASSTGAGTISLGPQLELGVGAADLANIHVDLSPEDAFTAGSGGCTLDVEADVAGGVTFGPFHLNQPATLAKDPVYRCPTPPRPTPPIPPIPAAWQLSVIAGDGQSGDPTPGLATQSPLGSPTDVAADAAGDVFFTDIDNNVVLEVTPSGQMSIVAGQVGQEGPPTPGPATSSDLDLSGPSCGGIAVDGHGDIYIADCGNDTVDEVTPDGELSVVAGEVGNPGLPTQGPAVDSQLDDPAGVAVDGAGNLYISDSGNNAVEKVDTSGNLSVIGGEPGQDDGDPTPGPATDTTIGSADITVDPSGNVFLADLENNLVEEVNTAGQLSIVAGVPDDSGTPTPGPATQSPLDFGDCGEVAVSATDQLFIADCSNDAVETVTPTGQLSVIAGSPGNSGEPAPGPGTSSHLDGPAGLAVSPSGDVFVADTGNLVVEELKPPN